MADTGGYTTNPRMAEATPDHPAPRRKGYYLEAWNGLECVAWAYLARPATVARRAQEYAADGADRLYVRWTGPTRRGLAANWENGSWRRVDDWDLAEALDLTDCAECGGPLAEHGAAFPLIDHPFVAYQAVRLGR